MNIETEATLAVWTTKVHNTLLPLIQTKNQPDFASWIYRPFRKTPPIPAGLGGDIRNSALALTTIVDQKV